MSILPPATVPTADVPEETYVSNVVAGNHLFEGWVRVTLFLPRRCVTEPLSIAPDGHPVFTFTSRGPPTPPRKPHLVNRKLSRHDHIPLEA